MLLRKCVILKISLKYILHNLSAVLTTRVLTTRVLTTCILTSFRKVSKLLKKISPLSEV